MSKKLSKADVNYRESKGSKACGNCAMYSGNGVGSCSLVQGMIRAEMVCDRWARQEKTHWRDSYHE